MSFNWLNKSTPITRDLIELIAPLDLFEISCEEFVQLILQFLDDNIYRDVRSIIIKEKICITFGLRHNNFWRRFSHFRSALIFLKENCDEGYNSDF